MSCCNVFEPKRILITGIILNLFVLVLFIITLFCEIIENTILSNAFAITSSGLFFLFNLWISWASYKYHAIELNLNDSLFKKLTPYLVIIFLILSCIYGLCISIYFIVGIDVNDDLLKITLTIIIIVLGCLFYVFAVFLMIIVIIGTILLKILYKYVKKREVIQKGLNENLNIICSKIEYLRRYKLKFLILKMVFSTISLIGNLTILIGIFIGISKNTQQDEYALWLQRVGSIVFVVMAILIIIFNLLEIRRIKILLIRSSKYLKVYDEERLQSKIEDIEKIFNKVAVINECQKALLEFIKNKSTISTIIGLFVQPQNEIKEYLIGLSVIFLACFAIVDILQALNYFYQYNCNNGASDFSKKCDKLQDIVNQIKEMVAGNFIENHNSLIVSS